MSKRSFFLRYSVILKRLQKTPASLKDIVNTLEREFDLVDIPLNYSSRTFQRDLEDIRQIFQVDIQYDFRRRVYFIEHASQPKITERMLEAFDVLNAFNVVDDLSTKVEFENRRAIGTEHFHGILHAVKNRFVLVFSYQKFEDEIPLIRTTKPLLLKEFKGRWYLIAIDAKDNRVKSFGLDRMNELTISSQRFESDSGVLSNLYKDSYGIINGSDLPVIEIELSFDPLQGKYIKTSPLHSTQRIIADNEDELLIKLNLKITHDFVMEILSMGANVKVITPETLKNEIIACTAATLKLYE
jgi:predicted DNA-binding transcriptional regulator YafY